MRPAKWFLTVAAALCVLGTAPAAGAADRDAADRDATGLTDTLLDFRGRRRAEIDAVRAILGAATPSAVVEAYSRGEALVPGRTAIARAYVRRMTDLGLPELAETQAQRVLRTELDEPVSLAVVATVRARSGDAEGAIVAVARAVRFEPENAFVRRAAGRILAWRDTRDGRMAEDVEFTLDRLRSAVAATPECAQAYAAARAAYAAGRDDAPAADGAAATPADPRATLLGDDVEADYRADGADDGNLYYATTSPWRCRPYAAWGPYWSRGRAAGRGTSWRYARYAPAPVYARHRTFTRYGGHGRGGAWGGAHGPSHRGGGRWSGGRRGR